MKKILAIDYGRKNLGFSFTESLIADPLSSVRVKNSLSLLESAKNIVEQFNPELIVIGLPGGELKDEVDNFARDLFRLTKVECVLHPETLSTKEAINKLRESGASKKKLKNDHSYAAALILEDYLIDNS